MGRPKGTKLLNRSLMHAAARLHYNERLSQLEVSQRMQVSTATVSRLLSHARDEGIVRIQVADLDETDALGDKLQAALGLRAVRVVESAKAVSLSSQVGSLLTEAKLAPGAVVAIGWGRTVQSVIAAGLPSIPNVIIVPTAGGMHETASHFQINEFIRTAAEQMQGEPHFLYAPSIATPELLAVLSRDPDTARMLSLWSKVDAAIVGVGDFQRSTAKRNVEFAHEDAERVVGDVVRHYFDQDGEEVTWIGQDNLVAISRKHLKRIPLSIGVAIGNEKAQVTIGAARSGMINALVTDTRLASQILERLEGSPTS